MTDSLCDPNLDPYNREKKLKKEHSALLAKHNKLLNARVEPVPAAPKTQDLICSGAAIEFNSEFIEEIRHRVSMHTFVDCDLTTTIWLLRTLLELGHIRLPNQTRSRIEEDEYHIPPQAE